MVKCNLLQLQLRPTYYPIVAQFFLTATANYFYWDIQCRVMLTKAKVQISSIYFLGYIWFSRLLSVAKFRILHGIYQ